MSEWQRSSISPTSTFLLLQFWELLLCQFRASTYMPTPASYQLRWSTLDYCLPWRNVKMQRGRSRRMYWSFIRRRLPLILSREIDIENYNIKGLSEVTEPGRFLYEIVDASVNKSPNNLYQDDRANNWHMHLYRTTPWFDFKCGSSTYFCIRRWYFCSTVIYILLH